jgi:hypothetical protein
MFTKKNNNNRDKVHTPLYTTVLKRTVKLTLVQRKRCAIFIFNIRLIIIYVLSLLKDVY